MRIPDLDLDLLRAFVAVAERGGFTAAGQVLGLTQSAVSLKLKRLEELVGRPLLTRLPRGVALTRDGEALIAYARRMLALNEEAVRRLAAPRMAQRLRLGVADHFVPRRLPALLAGFQREYPELRLEVEVGRSHELRAALSEGRFDLVVGKRRDGETEGRLIFSEDIVWVAAPGFTPPPGRPLPLAMLPQGCMFRDRALAALARAGIAFEVVFTSSSLSAVAAAAAAGLGVAVLGRQGLMPGVEPLPGLPELGTAQMCIFGDEARQSALIEPLLAWLRNPGSVDEAGR
ncbi:MAG: LysR substrate-binding domain-containing protein [Rhodovarius sp.]|nr:LysR substrate-binding domain-containing protein [Rhodovarius sp.]